MVKVRSALVLIRQHLWAPNICQAVGVQQWKRPCPYCQETWNLEEVLNLMQKYVGYLHLGEEARKGERAQLCVSFSKESLIHTQKKTLSELSLCDLRIREDLEKRAYLSPICRAEQVNKGNPKHFRPVLKFLMSSEPGFCWEGCFVVSDPLLHPGGCVQHSCLSSHLRNVKARFRLVFNVEVIKLIMLPEFKSCCSLIL